MVKQKAREHFRGLWKRACANFLYPPGGSAASHLCISPPLQDRHPGLSEGGRLGKAWEETQSCRLDPEVENQAVGTGSPFLGSTRAVASCSCCLAPVCRERTAPPSPLNESTSVFTWRGTGRRGGVQSSAQAFRNLAISTGFPQPGALRMCSAIGPLTEDPGNRRPASGNRSSATCRLSPHLQGRSCPVLPPAGEQRSLHPSLGGPSQALQRSGQQRPVCGTRLKGAASLVCKRSQLPPALSLPPQLAPLSPLPAHTRPCTLPSGQWGSFLLSGAGEPLGGGGGWWLGMYRRGRWVGRMAPPSRTCSGIAAAIRLPELLSSTAG